MWCHYLHVLSILSQCYSLCVLLTQRAQIFSKKWNAHVFLITNDWRKKIPQTGVLPAVADTVAWLSSYPSTTTFSVLFSTIAVGPQSLHFRGSYSWDPILATEPWGEFCSRDLSESFTDLCISLEITKPIVSFSIYSITGMQFMLYSVLRWNA